MNTKIAFIGTGSMGCPMILKLLNHNYSVSVYDKNKATTHAVISAGAIWQDTPKLAVENADIVLTCLPLPEHVLENMLGEQGGLAGMKKGATWIDCSTTDYHNTQHIAAIAARQGVFSLEAPVSNLSHMGVDFANVSFYAGGDKEGFDASVDALNTMGKISFYVGKIGRGQTVKLLTNLLFYSAMIAWGEVLILAKTYHIPLEFIWDLSKKSQGNCFVIEQLTPFIFDGSYDSSCTLEITVKDTALTIDLANELKVDLPIGRIVEQRYRQAGERFNAQNNHAIVIKLIEEQNDINLNIANFIAPSKYGINPNYVTETTLIEDEYGRVKPNTADSYSVDSRNIDKELVEMAHHLNDFMAYANHTILQESLQLGKNMGLTAEKLKEVVRWSCGPSWVADHADIYQPNQTSLNKIAAVVSEKQSLCLPFIRSILSL